MVTRSGRRGDRRAQDLLHLAPGEGVKLTRVLQPQVVPSAGRGQLVEAVVEPLPWNAKAVSLRTTVGGMAGRRPHGNEYTARFGFAGG